MANKFSSFSRLERALLEALTSDREAGILKALQALRGKRDRARTECGCFDAEDAMELLGKALREEA